MNLIILKNFLEDDHFRTTLPEELPVFMANDYNCISDL